MTTALLQTTYFGPVQWYQKLYRYDRCLIEQHDSYQKQTFRNRCIISTANGLQALTVPVETGKMRDGGNESMRNCCCKDVRISDHNQWRRVHWNALQSAYSESPFFDYYADDIRPFFERKFTFLVDFNEEIRQTVCQLIDIHPTVELTTEFLPFGATDKGPTTTVNGLTPTDNGQSPTNKGQQAIDGSLCHDFRSVINAKHPLPDADFEPRPYWQVFAHRHGFQPNLSILDLLFCMGPEAIFYL